MAIASSSMLRLIPACAGTTRSAPFPSGRKGAHPRLRGDYIRGFIMGTSRAGSSPPARGLREQPRCSIARLGLIPACAGTTAIVFRHLLVLRAHPRLRGDYSRGGIKKMNAVGSSPPARGLLHGDRLDAEDPGLIPACAGTTFDRSCHHSGRQAHPRLRGDYNTPFS